MKKTFQEQLLQLGLVDQKKVNVAKKERHQTKKQEAKAGKGQVETDPNVLLARQAEEKKKARTQELNRQREEKLQKRADDARIRQLVEQYRLAKDERGIAYRFPVNGRIQRIFVAKDVAQGLSEGRLGIVGLGDQFEVVPREVLDKIGSISDRVFCTINRPAQKEERDPDDPYAGFEVPDDLMW